MKLLLNKSFFLIKILMLITLIATAFLNIKIGYAKESWPITEFLINYEGGFIRRGLLGQIIYELYHYLNILPYDVIIIFSLGCYLLLAAFLIYHFIKFKISKSLLLPSFLLGGPIIGDYIIRKDSFLLLCFVLIIKVLFSSKLSKNIRFFLINTIGIFVILSHEAYMFWGILPLLLLLVAKEEKEFNLNNLFSSLVKAALFILPILISLLFCIYFKGTQEMEKSIWDSWASIYFPIHTIETHIDPPAAIKALSLSFSWTITMFTSLFSHFTYGIYAPLGLLFTIIISITLTYRYLNKSPQRVETVSNSRILLNIIIIQSFGILCLSIVACDYGRWIFIWLGSSLILYFLVPINILVNAAAITNNIAKYILNIGRKLYLNKLNINILFLFSGVCMVYWEFENYRLSTPLGIILNFIFYLFNWPSSIGYQSEY